MERSGLSKTVGARQGLMIGKVVEAVF